MAKTKFEYLGQATIGNWVPAKHLKRMGIKYKPTQQNLSKAIKKAGPKGEIKGVFKGTGKNRTLTFISRKNRRK